MNYWPLFLSLIFTSSGFGFKILCLLPYPGKSHNMVFEPLIKELLSRGHQLTVVSFFPSATPHPNRRDVSLVGLAPISVEVIDMSHFDRSYFGLARYLEHIPVSTELAKKNLELCEKLLDAEVFKEFMNAEGDYDAILVEHFNSDCMLGLVHAYGAPSVGLSSCVLLPYTPYRVGAPENPSYVPGMTLPLTDKMTFLERVENTIMLYFYVIWFEVEIRWKEQELLEKKFGRALPSLEEVGKNASVILVNTHHSLNGVRVLPPSVVEVGGIHIHNRTVKLLPPDLEQWVSEAESGFILFSFGSLVKGSTLPKKRLHSLLNVFRRLPHRIIWKWEADEVMEVSDNVRLMRWLPQYDLLHHPNCVAFISHAGLLSLIEAVASAVPMLAIPILGDQFGNAAHAKIAGVAEVLPLRELDEESFEKALKSVLDGKMRNQAKRLSKIWKDNPMGPMDKAVYYVEKISRHGGLELSSRARSLNRFQLALLDIFAFLAALIVTMFVILIWMCKICIKSVSKRNKLKNE